MYVSLHKKVLLLKFAILPEVNFTKCRYTSHICDNCPLRVNTTGVPTYTYLSNNILTATLCISVVQLNHFLQTYHSLLN